MADWARNAATPWGWGFPGTSLVVGSPGKVVGTLEPEQVEFLKGSAAHYVQNWKRYVRDLKPV